MAYSGIKIPKKVIIVEKLFSYAHNIDGIHQGYVVDADNKDMLESAMEWAKYCKRKEDGTGYETVGGIQHIFENGKFKISLKYAANGSSQGGKLSFWNCLITCPDNQQFLIGINSEVLIEFLLNNTLVNGVCDADVFLGRVSGNVGIFTENMPSYKQFLEDEAIRASYSKKTSNYKPGDIVSTLTTESIYLGIAKARFSAEYSYSKGYTIHIYKKPHIIHIFKDSKYGSIDELTSKPKRAITGHEDSFPTPQEAISNNYGTASKTYGELNKLRYLFEGTDEELVSTLKILLTSDDTHIRKPNVCFEFEENK